MLALYGYRMLDLILYHPINGSLLIVNVPLEAKELMYTFEKLKLRLDCNWDLKCLDDPAQGGCTDGDDALMDWE